MNSSVHVPTHEHRARDLITTCSRPRAVLHEHELTALAHCTKRTRARIAQKPTRTRTITCTCTGTVRSAGSSTHVAPNEALSYAHMLGTRERTRTLPLYVPGCTRAVQGPYTPISTRTNSAHVPRHAPDGVHEHELTALAHCTKRTWARIAQKPTRTRTITCTCTGTVRSAGSSTYVAPNEALSYAHMLGTRERTRTLPLYVSGFTRAVQGPYTPISTRTNSAHVPRHAPNGVVRPVTVQHDHARAHAVSDRLGDRCRHERRFRPVSVQASSGGSAGGVTGPGLSNRPR